MNVFGSDERDRVSKPGLNDPLEGNLVFHEFENVLDGDRLSTSRLPEESPLYPMRAGLIEYLDQKRFGLDLLSDAARYNDPDKLEWANRALNSNEQRMRAIDSLIRSRLQ